MDSTFKDDQGKKNVIRSDFKFIINRNEIRSS